MLPLHIVLSHRFVFAQNGRLHVLFISELPRLLFSQSLLGLELFILATLLLVRAGLPHLNPQFFLHFLDVILDPLNVVVLHLLHRLQESSLLRGLQLRDDLCAPDSLLEELIIFRPVLAELLIIELRRAAKLVACLNGAENTFL